MGNCDSICSWSNSILTVFILFIANCDFGIEWRDIKDDGGYLGGLPY